MTDDPQTLVSTNWLATRLNDPDLRILDGSWHMPSVGRDARAEFAIQHIPGAQFFDIDRISEPDTSLPHMAPSAERFARHMRTMGIGDGHQVVVYDNAATHSAARVWWMFRLMGKTDIAVLDGGLAKWLADGHAADNLTSPLRRSSFSAHPVPGLVRDVTQVASASKLNSHEIVDARPAARFLGMVPEPRAGLASGHIPGAKNLPVGDLYHDNGTMKDISSLRAEFDAAGIELDRPVITSCGSGITAASLSLALERLGHRDHALYDGSWTEWGAYPDLKVATGDV
ncbi:MAG: 3-mercaptopyruvate sulfurtransferase [Paracoccus sp. (in: a-proteobacteria)]